jgi:uncharacterized membrane-anchored protein
METLLLDIVKIPVNDPVAFAFFTGYMAMFAASVFFFFERASVDGKWKTSLLVSGLITGIAAVRYYYIRDYYTTTGENPAGAKIGLLWRLIIASLWMLIAG